MSSLNIVALIICFIAVVFRLYGAVKYRRWWLLLGLACLSICLVLTVQPLYAWIDELTGGQNHLNLAVKACLYLAFWALGMAFVQLYPSQQRLRLVNGWPGVVVLGLITVATGVVFAAIPQSGSVAGLADYTNWTNRAYSAIGKLYPAYISTIFVLPVWRVVFIRGYLSTVRWSSAFLGIGLGGTIIGTACQILVCWFPNYWTFTLSSVGIYVSVVAFMIGLLLINTRRWTRLLISSQRDIE